jgi:hypothetical protein
MQVTGRQHRRLRDLESAVGRHALVRYAAPQFWRYEDMWRLQGLGRVLDRSIFVAPGDVQPRHRVISWSTAGVFGHSRPEPIRLESASELGSHLLHFARERATPAERERPVAHLELLADAVAGFSPSGRPRERWRQEVLEAVVRDEIPPASSETIAVLADSAVIGRRAQPVLRTLLSA